jgi:hypothetical protein
LIGGSKLGHYSTLLLIYSRRHCFDVMRVQHFGAGVAPWPVCSTIVTIVACATLLPPPHIG